MHKHVHVDNHTPDTHALAHKPSRGRTHEQKKQLGDGWMVERKGRSVRVFRRNQGHVIKLVNCVIRDDLGRWFLTLLRVSPGWYSILQ